MRPLGSFRAKHLSMLVNDTRATVVRYTRKIAVIHLSGPPQGVSVQLPSYATEGRSATLLEARSVGQANQKEGDVAKEELLEFEGLVTEILPDTRYRIRLDNGHQLIAYTAGRMKRNRIKTLAGDRVTAEVSPYSD